MKLLLLRPMIWSAQLKETVDFYTNQLGFTCGEYSEDRGWAAMHRDEVEIMVARPNAHTSFEQPLFTGSFYINTDDVDGLWQEFREKATVAYPIDNFEHGMREFAIYDNNGYMLQFGREIKTSGL